MPCVRVAKPSLKDYFLKTDEQILYQVLENLTEELPEGLTSEDLLESLTQVEQYSDEEVQESTFLW